MTKSRTEKFDDPELANRLLGSNVSFAKMTSSTNIFMELFSSLFPSVFSYFIKYNSEKLDNASVKGENIYSFRQYNQVC